MPGSDRAILRLCPLLAIGLSLFVAPIGASISTHLGRVNLAKYGRSTASANKTGQDPLEAILVDPILKLGSRLLRKMGTHKNNTIFSPLAIHSALNLVLLGAKSGSETEMELLKTLGYTECEMKDNKAQQAYEHLFDGLKKPDRAYEITKMSNKRQKIQALVLKKMKTHLKMDVWTEILANSGHDKPRPKYLDSISKYHKSSMKSAGEHAQVMGEINEWAKGAGFEKGVIEAGELKDNFNLMLLSAAQAEVDWVTPFTQMRGENIFYNHGLSSELISGKVLKTTELPAQYVRFTTSGNAINKEKVTSCDNFKELAKLDFHAVDIPLKGSASLACFMPNKRGTGDELAELERELLKIDDNGMLNLCKTFKVLDKGEASQMIGHLLLPKFTIGLNIDLKVPLQSMGLKRIFDETKSELTKMLKKPSWFKKVKHLAAIGLLEQGLSEHGRPSIVASLKSGSKTTINLDHPFLFVVRYKRIPILMGHFVELNTK